MLVLGFGMNAYFKVIKSMLQMMFWVCIANLPLLYIFASYETFPNMPLASLSLGNMGGANTLCTQVPRHTPNISLQLQCASGFLDPEARTKEGKLILQMGIIDSSQLDNTACSYSVQQDPFGCSAYINFPLLQ
jgi:hypothetical protein